jgi:hypothetical protein
VKLFSVGSVSGTGDNRSVSEEFVLYSDGTLTSNNIKLTGNIEWTEASSPSKNVYGKRDNNGNLPAKPANGIRYNSFEDIIGTWHKQEQKDDTYYCHTDNGGATWHGPF